MEFNPVWSKDDISGKFPDVAIFVADADGTNPMKVAP